jgi:hypothetical protein
VGARLVPSVGDVYGLGWRWPMGRFRLGKSTAGAGAGQWAGEDGPCSGEGGGVNRKTGWAGLSRPNAMLGIGNSFDFPNLFTCTSAPVRQASNPGSSLQYVFER